MKQKLIPKFQHSGVIQPILVTPQKVGHDYTVYDNREMIPEGAELSDNERHKQEAKRGAIAVNRAQNAAAKPLLHLTANGLMFVPGGQFGMAAY